MAATYDIQVEQDRTFTLTVTYTGLPLASGYTAAMHIRRKSADQEDREGISPVLSLASGAAVDATGLRLSTSGSDGVILVTIAKADTRGLSGTYVYDLVLTKTSNSAALPRVIGGKITVVPSVTR